MAPLKLKSTGLLFAAVFAASLFVAEKAEANCGSSEKFSYRLFGTFKRKADFKEKFKFTRVQKKEVSHELSFISSDFKTLIVKVNHLPNEAALKKDQEYTIQRTFDGAIGRRFRTLSVFDAKGLVMSISDAPNNLHVGITYKMAVDLKCKAKAKSRRVEAVTTLTKDGKVLTSLGAGAVKTFKYDGNYYAIRLIDSRVRKGPTKGIVIDGRLSKASYVIVRK